MSWARRFHDEFQRTSSTTVGGPWVEQSGDWEIVSSEYLKCLTDSGTTPGVAAITVPCPTTERMVAYLWASIARGPCRHFVRWEDADNNVFVSGTNAFTATSSTIYLYVMDGGTLTEVVAVPSVSWTTTPVVVIEDDGDRIVCRLNGVTVIDESAAGFPSGGYVGVGGSTQSGFGIPVTLTTALLDYFTLFTPGGGLHLGSLRIGAGNGL